MQGTMKAMEEWKELVSKNETSATQKLKKAYDTFKKTRKKLDIAEKRRIRENIKFKFNASRTNKTVEGYKERHATRGWFEEGHAPMEDTVEFTIKTNKNEYFTCTVDPEKVPSGCYPFMGDGGYYDGESCEEAMAFKPPPCSNWERVLEGQVTIPEDRNRTYTKFGDPWIQIVRGKVVKK